MPIRTIARRLWALPVTLIGLALILPYGGFAASTVAGNIEVNCRRIFPSGMSGQTWGHVIFYKGVVHPRLRFHEQEHVRQCEILGPIMLLAYPLASLWSKLTGGGWYRGNTFERRARKAAGQE